MNTLIDVAIEVQNFFDKHKWKYCIIGGLSVLHWGEPRLTRDVDFTLLVGFKGEENFIDTLLNKFAARVENAREFAIENRTLVLQSKSNIGIDISLSGLPFEEKMIERAVGVEVLPQKILQLCSKEDLIVLKAFAGRDTDWRDVKTVIARQGLKSIDWVYVDECLSSLAELKDGDEITSKLNQIKIDLFA